MDIKLSVTPSSDYTVEGVLLWGALLPFLPLFGLSVAYPGQFLASSSLMICIDFIATVQDVFLLSVDINIESYKTHQE